MEQLFWKKALYIRRKLMSVYVYLGKRRESYEVSWKKVCCFAAWQDSTPFSRYFPSR
jgi:hypothetical protein